MPIMVQWEWQELTKSFLVIFHFYDDFIKTNVRLKKMKFKNDLNARSEFERPTITWAPSHPELGLLSELLSYANIINGFKEGRKRKLRKDLEVAVKGEVKGENRLYWKPIQSMLSEMPNKLLIFEKPDYVMFIRSDFVNGIKKVIEKKDFTFCVELCTAYINYLKKVLNPYLRD